MKSTKRSETDASLNANVVPVNRPSEGAAPPRDIIYADVEMTQRATPSNIAIYASVQLTCEMANMGKSVDYVDLDFLKKDQQMSTSADKIAACLSPIYSEPYEKPASASNTEYAEPFKSDETSTAT